MKLVMTGGGDSSHFLEIDQYFIRLLGNSPKLLYFPFAQEKKNWKDGHLRIANTFSSINFSEIKMCQNLKKLDWNTLKQYSAIYIDGGNTFELMGKIRNTQSYELLKRFLHEGGVINGDSAGAIVLGSHLATAHFGDVGDENLTGIVSYQGLNILGDWAVHCHYEESEDDEIMKFSTTFGFPVIALSEASAIAIDGNGLKVIGEAPVVIFHNNEIDYIAPGGEYHL